MAGENIGVNGRGQVGAFQVEINRDLRALHLQDFRIGLHCFGQRIRPAGVAWRGGGGANLRFPRPQRFHQHVIGVLVLLLILQRGRFLQGFLRCLVAASGQGQGGAGHHHETPKTLVHENGH